MEQQQNIANHSDVPWEVKKWNWGAFLLGWIWAIGNRVRYGWLTIIPIFGIIMCFILGAKGNEWAWEAKPWKSVEHFRSVQRKWAWWAVGIHAFVIMISAIYGGKNNPFQGIGFLFLLIMLFCLVGIIYPTKAHKYFGVNNRRIAFVWFVVMLLAIMFLPSEIILGHS